MSKNELKNLDPAEQDKRRADQHHHKLAMERKKKDDAESARYVFTEREKFAAGILAVETIAAEGEKAASGDVDDDRAVAKALVMSRRAKRLRALLGEYDDAVAKLEKDDVRAAAATLEKRAAAHAEKVVATLPGIPTDRAFTLAYQFGPFEAEREKLHETTTAGSILNKKKVSVAREIYDLLDLTARAHCLDPNPFMALCVRGGLKPKAKKQ